MILNVVYIMKELVTMSNSIIESIKSIENMIKNNPSIIQSEVKDEVCIGDKFFEVTVKYKYVKDVPCIKV